MAATKCDSMTIGLNKEQQNLRVLRAARNSMEANARSISDYAIDLSILREWIPKDFEGFKAEITVELAQAQKKRGVSEEKLNLFTFPTSRSRDA